MWAENYKKARQTQENKNFIKVINESFADWTINDEESIKILEEYKKLKSNVLAITKEELANLATWLQIEGTASLRKVLNTLKKRAKNSSKSSTDFPDMQKIITDSEDGFILVDESDFASNSNESDSQNSLSPKTWAEWKEEIDKKAIYDYFGIKNIEKIESSLQECWLDLSILLNWYKDFIENQLKWLEPV